MKARILMALAIVATLALPAGAAECTTVEIGRLDASPLITSRSDQNPAIRIDLVGHFLWVQYGHEDNPDSLADDIMSVDVAADATSATVCDDGSVTFESAAAPASEDAEIGTATNTVSLPAVYPEIWERLATGDIF